MSCRKPSKRLILALLKWLGSVAEVVIDMEAGGVEEVAVVEVGIDDTEAMQTSPRADFCLLSQCQQPTPRQGQPKVVR